MLRRIRNRPIEDWKDAVKANSDESFYDEERNVEENTGSKGGRG